MIEQERRAVDQCPGDILGGGEPPVAACWTLISTSRRKATSAGSGRDRPLGELELVA